jgi:hypothetical protein
MVEVGREYVWQLGSFRNYLFGQTLIVHRNGDAVIIFDFEFVQALTPSEYNFGEVGLDDSGLNDFR